MIKEIFIGELLELTNPTNASVQIGSKELVLFEQKQCPENIRVETTDFTEGTFSVVVLNDGQLISNELIKVKSPFIGKTKKEQLREMINDLDKVIQYRLTNNEEAIQQMSINGKSFVYETLEALMNTRKKLVANLANIIKSEDLAKGKSPILTIKARFRNA
ncbi:MULTISPECIES: hypothetical protein [Klebsiella/Raoultella group]|uniref:hypothetical protein n=1 Tax=Klebsiella/Raoultella group TaxID=2890311 RepID=UPI0010A4A2E4|nr:MULTISPECIES: hypothetical protein [Klebsiella/Raoultella group]MBY5245762.1 hypothetical protein [Klebsiella quasipneumoniae]MCF8599492.1 hypothetical protein [Klebsiella sp. 2019SCSN059]MCJ6115098.1 hypothetical protein [Klebsiella variicola]THE35831.1 hypothetical protein DJ495_23845 [Raoultella ornithinolytica]GKM82878.1 hypothetical protein NUKP68_40280 [Klebsiella variicola]